MERPRLLVFDLDGTLIDSSLDLCNSVNAAMEGVGKSTLPNAVIASYIGDGAAMLVRRALGDPGDLDAANPSAGDALFHRAFDLLLAHYREHKLDNTRLYEGIPEALASIRQGQNGSARQLVVLSNKPVNPSRVIVEALGLQPYFVQVYGGNSFPTKKPDPLGARKLLEETRCRPDETVIVGDSANDVLTGRNAGLWTCGVTYGFAPQTLEMTPPDVVVETPEELGKLFG